MFRDPLSHKGDNGKVAIIGGSLHQHGAPILSALAAEKSGVDLLYVFVPHCHTEVAKVASLNFQVYEFGNEKSDEFTADDVSMITEFLATMDCAVIGPGLSRTQSNQKMIKQLIAQAPCPLVCDASALQSWTMRTVSGRRAVVTPHLGELERMGIVPESIGDSAQDHHIVIHLKAATDRIADTSGEIIEVSGGNAGLTHGGTGDSLAGLIAGLIAQKVEPANACAMAATIIKRVGSQLSATHGYAYTAYDVINCIPALLHSLPQALS